MVDVISNKIIQDLKIKCLNHNHLLKSKHIAVVIQYNIPITNYMFNCPLNTTSIHAEINAIYDFFKKYKLFKNNKKRFIKHKKLSKKLSSCSLIVLRTNKYGSFLDSKPCYHCLKMIKELKIKYIYYTISTCNNDNNIVKEKVKDMFTTHVSCGNK